MKNLTKNDIRVISIIIGFFASLMILFTALQVGDSNTSYTGIQVAFGHEFLSLGGFGSGQIKFSILNVLAYSLPLVGSLVLVFMKKGYIISTILFGLAAVLLFLVPEFTVVTVTVIGSSKVVSVDWTYSAGLIVAASLSLFGLFIGLFRIYRKD